MAHAVRVPQSQFCRLCSNPFKLYGSLVSMGKAFEAAFSDSERRCNNISRARSNYFSRRGSDEPEFELLGCHSLCHMYGPCRVSYFILPTSFVHCEGILRYFAFLSMRCFVGIALDWDARPKHSAAVASLYF
jgi:hypothetical protein